MVFVFLEGYAAGAPSYTTCADANLGGHGGNSSADVRVRDRRPPPGEARQPALVDDPGAPVRDCTRGWWLARDLHGGPHPLGRGALGSGMRAISRILFRMSAKYMQRGFDGLLALAEESSVRSAEFVNGRREP